MKIATILPLPTKEQEEDIALFRKLFKGSRLVRLINDKKTSIKFRFMEPSLICAISNIGIFQNKDKEGKFPYAEINESVFESIRPFLQRTVKIIRENGGVFNLKLKSGLYLEVAPTVERENPVIEKPEEEGKEK